MSDGVVYSAQYHHVGKATHPEQFIWDWHSVSTHTHKNTHKNTPLVSVYQGFTSACNIHRQYFSVVLIPVRLCHCFWLSPCAYRKLKKLIRYIKSKRRSFQEEEREKKLQRYETDHFLEPFAGLTPEYMEMSESLSVCACVWTCVRVCVLASVHACVYVCVCWTLWHCWSSLWDLR